MSLLKFNCFQSAITHHNKCPFCRGLLSINNLQHMSHSIIEYDKITFFFDQDTLTINMINDQIEMTIKQTTAYKPIYSMGCSVPYVTQYSVNKIPTSGTLIQGINIDCIQCCKFSYTIQMFIDILKLKISGLFLNSENFTYEDDYNQIHEIKNIYSLEKTEYTSYLIGGEQKTSTIPLVPLNYDNPKETISRIRKLLIFS